MSEIGCGKDGRKKKEGNRLALSDEKVYIITEKVWTLFKVSNSGFIFWEVAIYTMYIQLRKLTLIRGRKEYALDG